MVDRVLALSHHGSESEHGPVPNHTFWVPSWDACISGEEFEQWAANLLTKHGYDVQLTRRSGDYGANLILSQIGPHRIIVQVNFWNSPVGNGAVPSVAAAKPIYRADEAWVVTNSTFTDGAITLAKANGVLLWDGCRVRSWLHAATVIEPEPGSGK